MRRHSLAGLALFGIALLWQAAPAAGQTSSSGAQTSARVTPRRAPEVQVSAIEVDLRVDGPTMRVVQRIELSNPTDQPKEFDLVFPLADGAVISGLDLRLGDQVLEGGVLDAETARRIYRDIVRRSLDPALLEHYGEALYRARVFPVPARGTQTLTLSYTRVVPLSGGVARIHVPLSAFHRCAPAPRLVIAGEILSPHPITTLYSPTHDLDRSSTTESGSSPRSYRSTFRVEQASASLALDFTAFVRAGATSGLLDVTVLSQRPFANEDGYFLAVINGLAGDDLAPEPRDLVFVLDRSGSMSGDKFEQARGALAFILERLQPKDRFNIVAYSSAVDHFAGSLQSATPELIASAKHYLAGLTAEGGTNIQDSLAAAMALFEGSERVNQVVFLTDGLPTVNERDERKLTLHATERNLHHARIVAFGVGFDVNSAFLDRVAVENRGMSEYVLPNENIEEKVPGFYARMQSPLLLDTSLEFVGKRVRDLFPQRTGDIYSGHQLVLTGRFAEAGDAVLRIGGRRGGASLSFDFPVRFAESPADGANDLVARIWAAKKVGFLVDEMRLHGEQPELIAEIVRLGTRFGILTEYTAFLAAEETDLTAFEGNVAKAGDELARRVRTTSGADGVSQAKNSKMRQREDKVTANQWYDDKGQLVEQTGVQNVGGKTFFKRGATWQDSAAPSLVADESVELFSDAFFELLDRHPWLASCIARTGNVVVHIEGRTIRIE